MPKNIAFFADGTWDEPANNSNVNQLYNAAAKTDNVQLTFYDSGVGTDGNPISDLLGGALGAGLVQKIKQGYTAIAAQYLPGDQIFIFGFSRGAYTGRSLAGMIATSGLPTVNQNDPQCLDMAFEAYRNISQRQMLLDTLNETYQMDNAKIQLLGVWDTVGSLGIPALFGGIDVIQYGFLDTGLHPDVLNAVQALSIDERRLQFQPALWTSVPVPGQSLTQVWFSGVHCDVGGGYPPDPGGLALSNITLHWMASYARNCGLAFNPDAFPPEPQLADALATLHNSLTGLYRLTPHSRNIVEGSSLCVSVQQRCQTPTSNYAPENLHLQSGQLAGGYTMVPW
ncbi:MAG: DUF2235 domain-containing protein [Terracidiphilus sp.]|jgi:uncharacterized protein (DUF2235 family)